MTKCRFKSHGRPCRNYCNFAHTTFTDPKDGKMKVAFTSFADPKLGLLGLLDPRTDTVESYPLEVDDGAWALLNYNNDSLIIGTCARGGYILKFDLHTRTWSTPLHTSSETYIWHISLASDGCIYGGTYGNCHLVKYDPEKHEIYDLGHIGTIDGAKNNYSRKAFSVFKDNVLVSCGYDKCENVLYNIITGEQKQVGDTGEMAELIVDDFVVSGDRNNRRVYRHIPDFNLMPDTQLCEEKVNEYNRKHSSMDIGDGIVCGFDGQEYWTQKDGVKTYRKIPGDRPPTHIMTLASGTDGKLWGCTGLGMTLFNYDTQTGEYNNTVQASNAGGGEVYGMVFVGDSLYMTSYSAGLHLEYKYKEPWNHRDDKNPKLLKALAPELIRPHSRSIVGPDKNIWTAWFANYGVYGGGISKINVDTNEVSYWCDPVSKQSINAITCDDKYLYASTFGSANGLSDQEGPYHLFKFSTDGNVVDDLVLPIEVSPTGLMYFDGMLILSARKGICVYNPQNLNLIKTFYDFHCHSAVKLDEKTVIAFCDEGIYSVSAKTHDVERIGDKAPGHVHHSCCHNGKIFFSVNVDLYELIIE